MADQCGFDRVKRGVASKQRVTWTSGLHVCRTGTPLIRRRLGDRILLLLAAPAQTDSPGTSGLVQCLRRAVPNGIGNKSAGPSWPQPKGPGMSLVPRLTGP